MGGANNTASPNQQRANHQVVASSLSPGAVRLVTAATPLSNSGANFNNGQNNQLLLTQALTPTPTRAQQANPYGIVQEGVLQLSLPLTESSQHQRKWASKPSLPQQSLNTKAGATTYSRTPLPQGST